MKIKRQEQAMQIMAKHNPSIVFHQNLDTPKIIHCTNLYSLLSVEAEELIEKNFIFGVFTALGELDLNENGLEISIRDLEY